MPSTSKPAARKKSTSGVSRPGRKSAKSSVHKKQAAANHRWVKNVKTVSTFPPKDLFKKDAETIARGLASKRVSPKGIGSGIRMLQYFINRAGKGLSAARKRELEKAKRILHTKLEKQRDRK